MCDFEVKDLPANIRSQLYELEIELAEGDITQQGFDKKSHRILENFYVQKNKSNHLTTGEQSGVNGKHKFFDPSTTSSGYNSYNPPTSNDNIDLKKYCLTKTSEAATRDLDDSKNVSNLRSPLPSPEKSISNRSAHSDLNIIKSTMLKLLKSPPNLHCIPSTNGAAMNNGIAGPSNVANVVSNSIESNTGFISSTDSDSDGLSTSESTRYSERDSQPFDCPIACGLKMVSQSPEKKFLNDNFSAKVNNPVLPKSDQSKEFNAISKTQNKLKSSKRPGTANNVNNGASLHPTINTNYPRKQVKSLNVTISSSDDAGELEIIQRKNAMIKRITRNESRHNSSNTRHKAVRMALLKSLSPTYDNLPNGTTTSQHQPINMAPSLVNRPIPHLIKRDSRISSTNSALSQLININQDITKEDDEVFCPMSKMVLDDELLLEEHFKDISQHDDIQASSLSYTTTTSLSNNTQNSNKSSNAKPKNRDEGKLQTSFEDDRHYVNTKLKMTPVTEEKGVQNQRFDYVYSGELNMSSKRPSSHENENINLVNGKNYPRHKGNYKCNDGRSHETKSSFYYTTTLNTPPDSCEKRIYGNTKRVSEKIKNLLDSLQKSNNKDFAEYFKEEDDEEDFEIERGGLSIKPRGVTITPTIGEPLLNNSTFVKSLENALYKYGVHSTMSKNPAFMVLDMKGKFYDVLTYGKLLKNVSKIAYNLINKVSYGRSLKKLEPGDRVALVFPNTDPLNFAAAFYGCIFAGFIPVPVDVPISKKDAMFRQTGFLLSSLGINLALTSETCFKALTNIFSNSSILANDYNFKNEPPLMYNYETNAPVSMSESSLNVNERANVIPVFFDHLSNGGLEIKNARSWPVLTWFSVHKLTTKPPKDWQPPALNPLYNNVYASTNSENNLNNLCLNKRSSFFTSQHRDTAASNPSNNKIDNSSTEYPINNPWQYKFDSLNVTCPENLAYIEGTSNLDGSIKGVMVTKSAMISHCKALITSCNYQEGNTSVCVQDFKRDMGLWHGILCSIYAGMTVIFIPYSLMKTNPSIWLNMVSKFKAQTAIVKSRDLHWGLLAHRAHQMKDLDLSSLRNLLISDAVNPWSLSSCEAFYNLFHSKGLKKRCIITCAWSSETQTISLLRVVSNGNDRKYLRECHFNPKMDISMLHLSHNLIEEQKSSENALVSDKGDTFLPNPLTTLTLQSVGLVLPASTLVAVKTYNKRGNECELEPRLCQTDEIGEICLSSKSTAIGYWGLVGLTSATFKVNPRDQNNVLISDSHFVRSGLYGYVNSEGYVFVVGSRNGQIIIGKRRHNTDDLVATVLAVSPLKFIYRGRLALFSIYVFRDERIVLVAEQRPDCTEQKSFYWMSRVLQAIETIHQVAIYCIALVPPNHLPKSPFGGVMVNEVKKQFIEGCLHPVNILMCPNICVKNLPKQRLRQPEVSPASQYVGNMVKGQRFAIAYGAPLGNYCHDGPNKWRASTDDLRSTTNVLIENLSWRAKNTPDAIAFTLLSSKAALTATLTFLQLSKKIEKLGYYLVEKSKIIPGEPLALLYPPGFDYIVAFLACLSLNIIPIPMRPPTPANVNHTITTIRLMCDIGHVRAVLTTSHIQKIMLSKEVNNIIDAKSWPKFILTDESLPRRKSNWNASTFLDQYYSAVKGLKTRPTNDKILNDLNIENGNTESISTHNEEHTAYIDFSVTTSGTLIGVKISHDAMVNLCKSQKIACELYPSRIVCVCLDPYQGIGLNLWSLSTIYSGHHTILIPPYELDTFPGLWLSAISQYKIRDAYCSYNVLESSTKYYSEPRNLDKLVSSNLDLSCLRNCVVVGEERPRINLIRSFAKMFGDQETLKINPKCITMAFGSPINFGMCLQGASSPDPCIVYLDKRSLRYDRVKVVEKGSPHCLPLMECGMILPGLTIAIANPITHCLCADTHLGEIWVSSAHSSTSYYAVYGGSRKFNSFRNNHLDDSSAESLKTNIKNTDFYPPNFLTNADFDCRLAVGTESQTKFARTGYLGFLRRFTLPNTQDYRDALFIVGSIEESLMIRGMRFYPCDIEVTIVKSHKRANQCAVFTWPEKPDLLVAVIELTSLPNINKGKGVNYDREALDLIPATTNSVMEEHHVIVGVIVVLDKPGLIPINSRGQKQRYQLRDLFLQDKLDPVYVAYNM